MFTTILPMMSIVLCAIAIGFSIWSIRTVRRERLDRVRIFAAFSAELARLRADLEALQPPSHFPSPDGQRNLRRDRGRSGGAILGPILITVPDLSSPKPGSVAIPPELAERFAGIWELADSGATPEAIARATGQPIGRIELILGLRRPDFDEDEA